MLTIYSENHRLHHPTKELLYGKVAPHLELPERAESTAACIRKLNFGRIVPPDTYGTNRLTRIHSPELVAYLATAADRWTAAGRPLPRLSTRMAANSPRRTGSGYVPQSVHRLLRDRYLHADLYRYLGGRGLGSSLRAHRGGHSFRWIRATAAGFRPMSPTGTSCRAIILRWLLLPKQRGASCRSYGAAGANGDPRH